MNIKHHERFRFTFLLTFLLFICCEISFSQIVKTYPKTYLELRDDIPPVALNALLSSTDEASNVDSLFETKTERINLLSQASLSFNKSEPSISVNILKYYLKLSDDLSVPIAIQTNLAALNRASIDKSISSLLDEFGGLGNFSLEVLDKRLKPLGLFDFSNEKNGLFIESRLGAKAVDIANVKDNDSNVIGLAQALGSLRLNLPVVDTKQDQQGNLTTLLSASFQYSNATSYLNMFEEEISSTLFNLNFSAAFIITDQFSINGGLTLKTNEELIDEYWFISATLIPK